MYIFLALLLLSFLVVVHEGGHFMAARICGIEVEEFSVGMGPALFQKAGSKGTVFSLRLFPIGGFCAFYDENEDGDDPRGFRRQAVWKRFVTVIAGPLMNFIAAVLVIIIYLNCIGLQTSVPRVGMIEEIAASQGLSVGDEIVSINGNKMENASQISNAIMESNGETVKMSIKRGEQRVELQLQPFYDEEYGRYRLGFTFDQERHRLSLMTSVTTSFSYNLDNGTLILKTLRDLIIHGEGINEVTGPVGTIYVISEVTKQAGFDIFFELLAIISVNLGIMNLLPIPGLDGSRLLFLLVEGMRKKPIDAQIESRIYLTGFILLIGIMIIMTYKDIFSIINGLWG